VEFIMTGEEARAFADELTAAWNLSHYSLEVVATFVFVGTLQP
jgi:hypothetical protein